MVKLECQQCGAGLHWDGKGNIVKCGYCGTEYVMHPQTGGFGRSGDIYAGTGNVQGIPIDPNWEFAGMFPVESYVPKGWRVCARQAPADYYGDHAGNPYVSEAEFRSPDGAEYVLWRGGNMYTDRKLSRVPLFHGIDVLGSYLRVGSPFWAEDYCDYILKRDIMPASGKKVRVEEADAKEQKKQQEIVNNYLSSGFCQAEGDWKRVTYDIVGADGRPKLVSVETRVVDGYKGSQPMGGGFFGGFFGQMFQQNTQHLWETQYELIVVADRERFNNASNEAQKIFGSMRLTDDHERIRMTYLQHLQGLQTQTAMAVHQQEMASWDRQQGIINDTHNHIMNTMHEMNANTAATHDRVANLHSESIRGVNTYYTARPGYGNPDVVEADVRWDHVFQNTQNPDIFAASETLWLQPGVDFEELKKTNGNY